MKTGLILSVFALGMMSAPLAVAEDSSVGQKLYKKVCKNCHGPTAKGLASYPKLVGNSAEYLIGRLETYRAKEKIGPNSPLMFPHAAKLSDEDIASLVDYITTEFE